MNDVAISTVKNETHDIPEVLQEVGFLGGIVDNDLQRKELLNQSSLIISFNLVLNWSC